MTANKELVNRYMDGFRNGDRELILSCLDDDVAWSIPGVFDVTGKAAFAEYIVEQGFVANPAISVARLIEEDDVVVAEGSVRTERTDGTFLDLVFCNIFELRDGRIVRLASYLVPIES